MQSVKQYLDYRAYLRDFYAERRARSRVFSYRFMAKRVGMDHGYLVRLLQKKVHMADGHVGPFAALCGLSGRDREYFAALVRFNKSRDPDETARWFEKLMGLAGVKAHPLERDQFEYYSAWYHSAIRALLGHMRIRGDAAPLAKALNPPIPEKRAQESLELLERLGLAAPGPDGAWRPAEAIITTGGNLQAAAVMQFQREMIRLAEESLVRHPKDHRDISTVTLSIAAAELGGLRERIAGLRRSAMSLAALSERPDAVYQLNIQLFPLSRIPGD
jgi:uncharacterized protein (TIGR02147 family)